MGTIGGPGDDLLIGTSGDETFQGFGGGDRMFGGGGKDLVVYDNSPSAVNIGIGGAPGVGGFAEGDRLYNVDNISGSQFDDSLAGDNTVNTLWGNNGHDTLKGMGGADTLFGGSGDDVLTGGSGADHLRGGANDDTYFVDDLDTIHESGGQGVDTVVVSDDYVLPNGLDIEILRVSSNSVQTGFELFGNGSGNSIFGSPGDDYLHGNGGLDVLTGGGGNDRFIFDVAPVAANLTSIADFTPGDRVWINWNYFAVTGDPDEFFLGDAAQDAEDRIIYHGATGALMYDVDGTGPVAAIHFATLQNGPNLTYNDLWFYS